MDLFSTCSIVQYIPYLNIFVDCSRVNIVKILYWNLPYFDILLQYSVTELLPYFWRLNHMHLLFLSVFQRWFINPFKNAMNSTVFSKLKKEQDYHAYKK